MYKLRPKGQNNGLLVCCNILTYFDVKYTRTQVKKLLENHLDYPSLLCIKDTLSEYGIESAAIRKGAYSYADFEAPFICSIQEEDWPQPAFTVVSGCTADRVTYLDPISNKEKICSLDAFGQKDKEIVLLLDGGQKKDEDGYLKNLQIERTENFIDYIPVYAFTSVVLLSILTQLDLLTTAYWISLPFLMTSTIGLLVSLLLVWHEIDAHNPFIKEVCGGGKRGKFHCGAVLSSSGSQFLGISWSVWGFAYFATFFISMIFFPGQSGYLVLWSLLSVVALLYVPYSLYYQAKVVKQWCPLCLAVQAVLLVNSLLSGWFLYQQVPPFPPVAQPVLHIVSLGIAVLLLTYYAVPVLKRAKESRSYEKRWKKLRFHPDIFQSLLQKNTPVTVSPEGLGIVVGNPDAAHEIIKVCNPYCGPCSKAHPELEQIVHRNPDVKLRIIFTANGEEGDARTAPVAHLLAIEEKYESGQVQQALDDWYLAPKKDYGTFAEKYPMNGELKRQQEKIYAMRDWCEAMKIRATPTIFIDGYELPESYRIAELKNFF